MTWPITNEPLVIGRGDDCDIPIEDPIVSRRHCEVQIEFQDIQLKDLGSRNTTIVNGIPTTEGVLKPGDELCIGPVTFVIAVAVDGRIQPASKVAEETTTVLDLDQAVYLREASALPQFRNIPATIVELHGVFHLGLALASAESQTELFGAFQKFVRERLMPKAFWLATYLEGEDALAFYPSSAQAESGPPDGAMREAIRRRSGLLKLRRKRKGNAFVIETVLACPLVNAGRVLGAAAVLRSTPASVYDESDLGHFVAMVQTLAPHFEAMSSREQLRRDYDRVRLQEGVGSTLIGISPQMQRVREQIGQAAASRLNVLLLGETGTGKDLAARLIHDSSARRSHPFIVVNCPAIPRELFESEMFGHEKGAYTGAQTAKSGLVEEAHGGTLFLDEVGDLSLENQARLLRVAETGTFYRVGSTKQIHVDVRIIAATNRLTGPPTADAPFRLDLYYRLSSMEIHMPSLRERPEDLSALADYFVHEARHQARQITGLEPEVVKRLQKWTWPGNVRELRSCILRAAAMSDSGTIATDGLHFPAADSAGSPDDDRVLTLAEVEKRHIESVLRSNQGNVRAATRILEISRTTLYRKIEAYGIQI